MSSFSVLALAQGVLLLQLQIQLIPARVFERCELAAQLQHRYGLPAAQVATLVCIAQHSSDLNTAAFGGGSGPGGGSHGIFQISDVYWCSPPGQGAGCGLNCARLRDDDIADDVLCVRKIYAEHQRISGDGFTAWQAYGSYCRQDAASYVAGCGLAGDHHGASSYQHQQQQPQQHLQPQYVAQVQHVQQVSYPASTKGKIYSRCELAQELYYQHKLPMQQIPTWVCIAQHESSYNTAAVGRLNADGSADHGLFQISDLFWCTHDQRGGKGCHAACNQFLDSSIADDVQCIRKIHQEHTQISGDGFTAWTVYNRDCRNQRYDQVAACFTKPQPTQVTHTHPNAIGPVGKVSYAYPFGQTTAGPSSYSPVQTVSGYQGNPFLRPHPNAIGQSLKPQYAGSSPANPLIYYKQHTIHKQQQQQVHYQQQQQQQQHYYTTPKRAGKVYTRCELAQELYFSHKFPMQDLATWVCIAEHESRLDTSAVGRLNADGSADHGLFQISDLYWCGSGGGKGYHIDCNRLLDSDISDDVQCIRTIYEEHTRLSGDGFTAWTVYNGHCRDRSTAEIASCFDGNVLPVEKPLKKIESKPKAKGKIYQRCELAQELYNKHNIPMQEIPTWVCIAQHESSFNTAAVGRLNTDGSEDHGLFQISDLYWCSHEKEVQGGKACHIDCDRLLDSDISDDVQCIRTIHEEHTRISGDGFTAWTVYNGHCRDQSLAQLSDCFDGNEIAEAKFEKPVKASHYEEHAQVPTAGQQDYAANPFLKHVSIPQAIQAQPAQAIKTTIKPAGHINVIPNHPFGSNPFLQRLKPLVEHPAMLTESASAPKSSYSQNPFINPSKPPTANTIQATETKPSHSPNYNSNPFLNSLNKPTLVPAIVKPPITSTPRPSVFSQGTHRPYINSDIFRNEIIKFTATSSETTTTNHLRQSQPPTTRANIPITKPTVKTNTRPANVHVTTTTHWPNTKPSTTMPKVTSISSYQPTIRPTTQPTSRPTSQTTSRATTQPTARTTSQPTTWSTSRRTTTWPTSRPTSRTTTQPTIRSTTRATAVPTTRPTTAPSARPTTRPTIRTTSQTTVRTTTQKPLTYWTPNHPSTTIFPKTLSTKITPALPTNRSTPRTTSHGIIIPTTRPTTRATTTIPTTTTRPATRVITRTTTTRPITHIPTTKSTARPVTTPTTRPTTRATSKIPTTTRPTIRATAPTTTTRPITYFQTTKSTARPVTTPTTRPTTHSTTHGTSQIPTTTSRPTTRATTRTSSPRPSTQFKTTKPTTPVTIPTTRSTRVTLTTRSTTRFTTQPTTKSTTPSTSKWRQFTTTWPSPTPKITSNNTKTPTASKPVSIPTNRRPQSSTTPRPYLFTSTTVKSRTTTDPFSHPFFAKFNAKFDKFSTTPPTTIISTPKIQTTSRSTASPYYSKFQDNNAKVSSKTVYSYSLGQQKSYSL